MEIWISFIFIFLLFVCNRGFGFVELYELSISLYIAIYASKNFAQKRITLGILYLILFVISLALPNIFLLWGMIAILLLLSEQRFALIPLGLWLMESAGIFLSSYFYLTAIYLVLFFITIITSAKYGKYICVVIIPFIVGLEISDLYNPKMVIENKNYNVYGQSKTFQRISGCELDNGHEEDVRIIRNKSYGTTIPDSVPGIVIYDIDLQKEETFAHNERLQQQTPWNSQMYLGSQYILESLLADGALYSNIGITLKKNPQAKPLLSRPIGFTDSTPLILAWNKTLFLNDSDYFSSYIANYQKNLIQELVGGHGIHRLSTHSLNIACAIFILFYLLFFSKLSASSRKVSLAVWMLFVLSSSYISANHMAEGEIRMVGKIRNSHENEGFDGIPKKINACGYQYVTGDKNAIILAIKNGEGAVWKGERLIVAEPNTTIEILGHEVNIDESPLGYVDGIIDARNITVDDNVKGAIYEMNGVKIIGTGSPAKIQWSRFIK